MCSLNSFQLLQSFKIMDYSLLMGIHNLDQACREQASEEAVAGAVEQRRPQKSLYSTAIEAIQADTTSKGSKDTEDKLVTVESAYVKHHCQSFCRHSKVLMEMKVRKTSYILCLFYFTEQEEYQQGTQKERGYCCTLASLTFCSHIGE